MIDEPFIECAGAVWRVAGEDFDVDAFLHTFPFIQPSSVWRRGEARSAGRRRDDSGFNEPLSEAENFFEALSQVKDALVARRAAIQQLSAVGIESELDFGVSPRPESFYLSVPFDPADLKAFVDANVQLVVTFYPPDAEEDEDNGQT